MVGSFVLNASERFGCRGEASRPDERDGGTHGSLTLFATGSYLVRESWLASGAHYVPHGPRKVKEPKPES